MPSTFPRSPCKDTDNTVGETWGGATEELLVYSLNPNAVAA